MKILTETNGKFVCNLCGKKLLSAGIHLASKHGISCGGLSDEVMKKIVGVSSLMAHSVRRKISNWAKNSPRIRTHWIGNKNYMAVLSDKQVKEIRRRYLLLSDAKGKISKLRKECEQLLRNKVKPNTTNAMAAEYGINRSTVSRILTGQTWNS